MVSTALSAQASTLQIATGTGGAKTITAIAVGNPTNNSTLGTSDVQNTRIQIDAYARDYPAVDALAHAIAAAVAGGFNGVKLLGAGLLRGRDEALPC